jgi:hypothetical protein
MGTRFRKSIKLAPGVRMNLTAKGLSWTIGPRGASIGIGKRGTYVSTGIPGTGIYSRQRIGGAPATRSNATARSTVAVPVSLKLTDDGTLLFVDEYGAPAPANVVSALKRQQGFEIRRLLQNKCDEINRELGTLAGLHLATPDPTRRPTYDTVPFGTPPPPAPVPRTPGLLAMVFRRLRDRLEDQNTRAASDHAVAMKHWSTQKAFHDQEQRRRKAVIDEGIYKDPAVMDTHLHDTLAAIPWPRETCVSFELRDGGRHIFLDVDMPEIEEMPTKTASMPARGYRLSLKTMSSAQVQRLYLQHVHGVGFRIVGETFAALPQLESLVLSAYTQRAASAQGTVQAEYIYSVRIGRQAWSRIRFDNLNDVDVVDAMAQFDLRIDVTKVGLLRPITPFDPTSP